jgi:hypothetical protein
VVRELDFARSHPSSQKRLSHALDKTPRPNARI